MFKNPYFELWQELHLFLMRALVHNIQRDSSHWYRWSNLSDL